MRYLDTVEAIHSRRLALSGITVRRLIEAHPSMYDPSGYVMSVFEWPEEMATTQLTIRSES